MVLALHSAPVAASEPREVLIFVSAHGCADASDIAAAVHRDTRLAVRVVSTPEEGHSGDAIETGSDVLVEVHGQGQALTVDIRGAGLRLSQPIQVTRCETASEVAAALVVSALAPAPAVKLPDPSPSRGAPSARENDETVAKKAALMVDDLATEARMARSSVTLRIVAASLEAGSSAAWFYLGAAADEPTFYWWGAMAGTLALGTAATFVVDDDYTQTLLVSSQLVGAGLFVVGAGAGHTDTFSPYAIGGVAGAAFLGGALHLAGALVQRPASAAALAADYQLISSAERRSTLTAEQLANIEADFRRTESPFPRPVLAAPWLAGGALAVGAAFADTRGTTLTRTVEGVTGALLLGVGTLTLFPLAGFSHYQKRLRDGGFEASVGVTPGQGVSLLVHGKF
jgi:hypothetical protein